MNNLTIGIVSYNRPIQLARCLNSLLPLPEGVKVLVRDDCSPKIQEIKSSIRDILDKWPGIEFFVNSENVGYDRNLFEVVLRSQSSHVLLLGDDDMLEPGAIQSILVFLKNATPKVAFLRYGFSPELMKKVGVKSRYYKRNYSATKYFEAATISNNGSYLYNSILFSGLLFERNAVAELSNVDVEYKNLVYIQVAIFCLLNDKYGGYFINGPGVLTGSDGENGFGLNASSKNELDLADRSSVISKLKFNRRLIKVIDKLSETIGDDFVANFFKEYNFRNLSGMLEARRHSRSLLAEYWAELCSITRNQSFLHKIAFYLMWISPKCINEYLLLFGEKMIRSWRYVDRNYIFSILANALRFSAKKR